MAKKISIGGKISVYSNFESKEELLDILEKTNGVLSLVKENKHTGEFEKTNFNGLKILPDIKNVIESEGYETYDFDECLRIYKDIFENDERYLPFDNNELYITKDDRYEGCCTVDGYEFTTNDYHYQWTIVK